MELSDLFKKLEKKFVQLNMTSDQHRRKIVELKAETSAAKASNKALKAELAGIKRYHQQFLIRSKEAVQNMEDIDRKIEKMEEQDAKNKSKKE
jgi:Cu/Ag efflux pump CusA